MQDCTPDTFINVFEKYGLLITDKLKHSWLELTTCAMIEFNLTLTKKYGPYLKAVGFDDVMELAKFAEKNLHKMYSLQVMISVMLNKIHVCVLTPGGDFHTHKFNPCDICACTVHLAIVIEKVQ